MFIGKTRNLTSFRILLFLAGIGFGFAEQVGRTFLAKNAPKNHVAKTFAIAERAVALGRICGPFVSLFYLINDELPFQFTCACSWASAAIILHVKWAQAREVGEEIRIELLKLAVEPRQNRAFDANDIKFLEAQARLLPAFCGLMGRPTFGKSLVGVMFPAQKPGSDYDEVWARDILSYFRILYCTWKSHGHLQFMGERADVMKFELHLNTIRERIRHSERNLIRKAHQFNQNFDSTGKMLIS